MDFIKQVEQYQPINEQETADKAAILEMIARFPQNILLRDNTIAHMTSSGFIINAAFDKTLMIHHNIYQSWGWTGGHADGDADLLHVALKEAWEETGITSVKPLTPKLASLDILPVFSHIKRGKFVNTHLHLSCAYLLIADETEVLQYKPDENSGAKWIPLREVNTYCTETHMLPVYQKLMKKVENFHANNQ